MGPITPICDDRLRLTETAYAKINLALHVRRRRDDGYHDIETLFAFAQDGDRLTAEAAGGLSLTVTGPFAAALDGDAADNLVLRAARALATATGVAAGAALTLDKRLPVASGIGGALIVDQWLGALTGHFWALAGLGMLLVLSAATLTMAFQVLFGTVGIGLTVLLFVVLGNPSAGGAYQAQLLPSLWRGVGSWIPNGAGTDAVRRIVYFGGHGTGGRLLVIAVYVVVGVTVTLGASVLRARRGTAAPSAA